MALATDFDELIQNYNPCEATGNPIIRPVNNTNEFKKVIQNDYYGSRVKYSFSENKEVVISLNDNFAVISTPLSGFKCNFTNWLFEAGYQNMLLSLVFLVAIGLAGYTGKY